LMARIASYGDICPVIRVRTAPASITCHIEKENRPT